METNCFKTCNEKIPISFNLRVGNDLRLLFHSTHEVFFKKNTDKGWTMSYLSRDEFIYTNHRAL